MSMLTPPGMGGKYRITGDKYPRMRRPRGRRRIVLAAVAALVALGLVGWGTLQLIDVFTGGDDKDSKKVSAAGKNTNTSTSKTTDCKPEKAAAPKSMPKPGDITVNVLNATSRGGLAKSTADELKARGFNTNKFGNAPEAYLKKVKGAGILLGAKTAADDGTFKVLGTQLTGAPTKTDQRTAKDGKGGKPGQAAEVDLILGDSFKELDKKKDADKALAVLAKSKPTPSAAHKC